MIFLRKRGGGVCAQRSLVARDARAQGFYCLLYRTGNVGEKVGKKAKRGQRKDLAEQHPKRQLGESSLRRFTLETNPVSRHRPHWCQIILILLMLQTTCVISDPTNSQSDYCPASLGGKKELHTWQRQENDACPVHAESHQVSQGVH